MYNFTILRTCKQLNKQLFDLKCVLSSFPTHLFRQVHSIATQVSIDYIKKKYRTPDLVTQNEQIEQVGCSRMGDLVASAL